MSLTHDELADLIAIDLGLCRESERRTVRRTLVALVMRHGATIGRAMEFADRNLTQMVTIDEAATFREVQALYGGGPGDPGMGAAMATVPDGDPGGRNETAGL